jgi:hypothetical protein
LIAGIVIGALVLVAGFAIWSSHSRARSERRSVTTHQRALDVLGTASRRWEGVAPVRAPKPDEIARTHVRPTGETPSARHGGDEVVPTRRSGVRLVPPSGPAPVRLPMFVDEDVARTGVPGESGPDESATGAVIGSPGGRGRAAPFDHESLSPVAEVAAPSSRRARHRYRGGRSARRATSVAAAAVALAAIGVAGWQLASGSTPAHHGNKTSPSGSKGKKHHHPGGHKPAKDVVPTSVSASVVTYQTSTRAYTLTFSTSGPCWLGVQQGVGGKYLWMTTLSAGGKTSYKASGSIAVRLGAPPYVKVQLNGVNVELPVKNVQPYDITFSPPRDTTA